MRHLHALAFVLLACPAAASFAWAQNAADSPVPPALDMAGIHRAEHAIRAAIDDDQIPGAVLVIGDRAGVRYRRAFGVHRIDADRPLAPDALFDLASVTKPLATGLALAKLIDDGRLSPDDPVGKWLPSFATAGKEHVTVAHLMTHRSGLPPANSMRDYADGPAEALARIDAIRVADEPGARDRYSDLGYITLGRIVEAVSGRPLDSYLAEHVYGPLGLTETGFNPPDELLERVVPTEREGDKFVHGRVHDPRAAALGGVAGHAGLFSTADDLAKLCRMLVNGGAVDGVRVLDSQTVARLFAPVQGPDGATGRSLMWPLWTAHAIEPGATRRHSGFTGTMVWLDPQSGAFAVLLASRLQLGNTSVGAVRNAVVIGADEAVNNPQRDTDGVMTGIDALAADGFKGLEGRRVGLITNHTGVDRFGRRTIDLLHRAPNVNLVALFSPEHGIAGKLDEKVGHAVDEATGLRIWSLYGDTRQPTDEMLANVDTLVFDIQDIGTRFYTYISTMGLAMEAAAKHGKRFVVLDRPNPIAPLGARGPITDADRLHFIAYHAIPVTHGMTIGELAKLFNAERKLGADLRVVEMTGWSRAMWFDETGLLWIDPSPNMRNLTQATLYPAIGLLESANVSVGRGTDEPFERFGAPYIDGRKLASVLNRLDMPGVRFVPIQFAPDASKFKGESCGGVHVVLTDRRVFDPVRTGLTIARVLEVGSAGRFESDAVLTMLRNAEAQNTWRTIRRFGDLPGTWREPLTAFVRRAQPHLIYGPTLAAPAPGPAQLVPSPPAPAPQ